MTQVEEARPETLAVEPPNFLIEWPSPWEEFRSSLGPALQKSGRPLAGEAQSGLLPFRQMLVTWGGEILLLLLLIFIPAKLARMHPTLAEKPKYDVIYYSADELPRTEDNGGASAGRSGARGGQHSFHRSQAIRVARENVEHEKVVDAPRLNLPHSDSAVANLLAYKASPGPAPTEGLQSARKSASLPLTAVAPADTSALQHQRMLTTPTLDAAIVPPTQMPSRSDLRAIPLPGSRPVQVVPPPVSAPERVSPQSRLTLPAPQVVAPPPSQITRELAKNGPGFGPGELQNQVIPPPVATGSDVSSRSTALIGNVEVIAPSVDAHGPVSSRKLGALGGVAPVAPPVQADGSIASSRHGSSALGDLNAVAAPAPDASSLGGSGRGHAGSGLGNPMDVGAPTAPANSGGSGVSTGVVVSSQPGNKPGVPTGTSGSIALSPTGTAKSGIGTAGGGSGIDLGTGPGNGAAGAGTGSASSGKGRGADLSAKGGISPSPGTGGAGTGSPGAPPLPGVSVHGGTYSSTVTLPSFGTAPPAPGINSRSTSVNSKPSGITVVATSRSGGAFNLYGVLKGDKVYTIYIPTVVGTAVMQFADPSSASHPYTETLTSPQPLRTELPTRLQVSRLIIGCTLSKSGAIGNIRVLEPGDASMTAKVIAALPNWKFTPALHNGQPVDVEAILGFDIDTR